MNPNEHIPHPNESIEEIDMNEVSSVDDFIRELEAKEKDLHITSDLQIEIEDSEFNDSVLPDFVREGLPTAPAPAVVTPPAAHSSKLNMENELSTLKLRVFELRNERNEIQEKSDRRLKDFENFKYRIDRERRGSFIDQISNLATQMLPVLDNLNRAIDSVPNNAEVKDPAFKQFFDGMVLVNQQVNEVFSEMGVQPIMTVGETFDPNLHEAVATDNRDDLPANTISAELLRGYRIGNRIIRHSMVKVNQALTTIPKLDVLTTSDEDLAILSTPETETVASTADGE